MPRPCTVCASHLRPLIDGRLLAGHAVADIAREAGLNRQAVRRHRESHLVQHAAARSVVAEMEGDDVTVPSAPVGSFNERLQGLIDQAAELMKVARKAGDVRAALQSIREIRGIVDSQVRLAEIAAANPGTGLDGQPAAVVFLPSNGRDETPDPEPADYGDAYP